MTIKINVKELLFESTVVLMCGFKFITFPFFAKFGLALLWIIYALSVTGMGSNKVATQTSRLVFVPYIMMFVIFPLQVLANPVSGISFVSSVSRMVSQMLQACLTIGFAYAGFRLFGIDSTRIFFRGLVVNNIIGVIWAIAKFGIGQFVMFVSNPFADVWNTWVAGGRISNALELHEVTFTLGLFFISFFYSFYQNRKRREIRKTYCVYLIICAVLLYLGFKRIQFIGLVLMLAIYIVIKRRNKVRSIQFFDGVVWLGTTLFMYVYLEVISTDIIARLAAQYGINFMSRLGWFEKLTQYFSVTPFYFGRGWGTVSLIADMLKQGVHNDIMRNYIDFGFLGFLAWISYYLAYIPYKLGHKSTETVKLYLLLIVYIMITYMTDNTFTYMIFQASFIVIVMAELEKSAREQINE